MWKHPRYCLFSFCPNQLGSETNLSFGLGDLLLFLFNEIEIFILDLYTSTNPSDWRVVLGEHHLVDKEAFEQSRRVAEIYLHPKYKSMFLEGILDTPPDYDVGE